MAWAIIAAKLSTKIERTIVSTDSEKFAEIALSYGAEVPFLRPKAISRDDSLDIEFVRHALEWLGVHEGNQPEYLVLLYPPSPLRDPSLIDEAIEKIISNSRATSLRSSHQFKEHPYKQFEIRDGFYAGLCPNDSRPEYYNLPRQSFPPAYEANGYVDVIKTETVTTLGSLHGPRILPFITPNVGDVDSQQDLDFIGFLLSRQANPVYEYLKKNFPSEG